MQHTSSGSSQASSASGVPLVLPLDEAGDPACCGGKAASLSRLVRAGLSVPRGFCITTEAFRRFAEAPGGASPLAHELHGLDAGEMEPVAAAAATIRERLAAAAMPAAVEQAVGAALGDLADRTCAVRSSATAEDLPQASFAGQQETFLNVRGRQAILEAIQRCWISLFTDRAVAYRLRNGIDSSRIAMAVIVQEMVDARISGVMFTADPAGADRNRLVIEAVRGLGDRLVSGRVGPERIIVARGDSAVLERSGGTEDAETCLSDELVSSLAELAGRIERVFGGVAQDVEWAWDGEALRVLQSRPITATLPPQASSPRWVWTNANTGELLPEPVTPLTWSMLTWFLHELLRLLLGPIGEVLTRQEVLGLVAGRVYFNLSVIQAFVNALPNMSGAQVEELFGGEQGRLAAELAAAEVPEVRVGGWAMLRALAWLPQLAPLATHGQAWRMLRRERAETQRLRGLDLRSLSDRDLPARFIPDDVSMSRYKGAAWLGVGLACFQELRRICRVWLGDEHGELFNRLLASVGELDSAEAGLDLWRLAEFADGHPALRERILSTEGDRAHLAGLESGAEFLHGLDTFYERHGHHGRGEVDPALPRWSEMPGYVMEMLRGYLRGMGRADPLSLRRQRARQRRALTAQCRQRLRNPLKRWVFDLVLPRAQKMLAFREGAKSEVVRRIALFRFALLELGRRWAERRLLSERDDIFFLTLPEIGQLTRSAGRPDRKTIETRKAEHARRRTLQPPPIVIGQWDPSVASAASPLPEGRELRGLAISAGVAVGPARVILSTDTGQQVLPGEILVAPFTDPGWSPYFLPAAGIVMDLGGMLSHGAIVAREYGIPAVVNVGPATKIIRTGQTIRVDGNRGVVTIVE